MSPQDCRDRAEECERLANSFRPDDRLRAAMHEAAAQWRRLADNDEEVGSLCSEGIWSRALRGGSLVTGR